MYTRRTALAIFLLTAAFAYPLPTFAQEVWTGTDYYFAKADSADWMLPENQDAITESVILTRAHRRGLFNIAQEPSYSDTSPADTEWATGSAADWESLTFQTWVNWAGGIPPNTVGVEAVLHLISDDIYLDIRVESWSLGNEGGGGGFAYSRASGPTPASTATWGALKSRHR